MDFHPVEQNLRQMFHALTPLRHGCDVRELGGVSIVSLGAAFQMFNAVFLATPVMDAADFESRLHTASTFMQVRGLPWSFWLCEDWLPAQLRKKANAIASRNGLRIVAEHPGMAAEIVQPSSRKLPELDIQQVANERQRRAFCEIGAVCFHVPTDWFAEIFDHRMMQRDGFIPYVAYAGKEPVATAATVTAAGVTGLYNVAVLAGYRRRGFGEAVTRFALAQAKERTGLDRTILQSTRNGERMYERMGFSAVTRFLVFAS